MASPLNISTDDACAFKPLRPAIATAKDVEHLPAARRSGNYRPSSWDDNCIQSLKSVYSGEQYAGRVEKLKENVRLLLVEGAEPLDQLKLIDYLQRLGLSYHFEDEIETILSNIYSNRSTTNYHEWKEDSLFAATLEFRLLRQGGFHVPQEVFGEFMDETGNFQPCLSTDTEGLLSLYEATYISIEGDNILDDARNFTTKHLMENLDQNMDELLAIQVKHALELPLHWRMLRAEARWFIEVYAKKTDMNPTLLELAKLDFNMVQATHQKDLKVLSRWWRKMALGELLPFARDRLMECFYWSVGIIFEPEQEYCRRTLTKLGALITVVDDVYDVYGTLEELVLFTNAVERWDINLMEQLPDYMKICFLAVFNSINEMAYDALKEQGVNVLTHMKKAWADLCRAYLVEAKWYYSGYIPSLDEYLENGWISISVPVLLVHFYCYITKPITKDDLECIERYPNIIRGPSMIMRLTDDLGTALDELKRGDVPKSMQCYMHETGASEEVAREYIKKLINETWKKINEARYRSSQFSQTFIKSAVNFSRTSHFVYLYGDGHAISSHRETKDQATALFVKPIQM